MGRQRPESHVHITLPSAFQHRRFRVPEGVVLHHANVPPEAQSWFGAVPVTTPIRTLEDCAAEGFSPELLRQGARNALRRALDWCADYKESVSAKDEAQLDRLRTFLHAKLSLVRG